jgi:hypothetical protein
MFRTRRTAAVVLLGLAGATMTAPAAPAAPADVEVPRISVNVLHAGTAPGLVFVAPKASTGVQGPEIIDDQGRPVWFDKLPADQQATDFRVQTYRGKPVLTWWQGDSSSGAGHGEGVDYIADTHYHVIATVRAGDDYSIDQHEFRLTPQGTALVTGYHQVPYDLSSVGGPANGSVYDGVAQEIDIATGKVLFRWSSLAHVPVSASYAPVPTSPDTPYDYFHINAVNPDEDGNLLISSRHTSTVVKVDRHSGRIIWRLGGKNSDFTLGAGVKFTWQHNPLPAGSDTVRLFDNASNGTVTSGESRVEWIRLDRRRHTATLVRQDTHPDHLTAPSQGNAQGLPGGDTFVGWGQLGRISEFSPDGRLLFDASVPSGYDDYRAYRSVWDGRPSTPPTATAQRSGGTLTVHAIWNGATGVARWRVLTGSGGHLRPATEAPWNGLDTTIGVSTSSNEVQVQALDAKGRVLGTSAVRPITG